MHWIITLLINIVIACAIVFVAIWISNFVSRKIREWGKQHAQLDETLFGFAASLVRYTILAFAGVFVLAQFGVQTTSLVAIIGAAGLAIGLALQGTLSNLAAGVMLLGFRPFKVGDFIEAAGQSGTVSEIGLFTVILNTPDNVQITVPNSDIWSSAIKNYSVHDTRRVDMIFGVSYDSDLKKAETILRKLIKDDERVIDNPEPFVKVTNLGDSSVDFTVRIWCESADYWDLKFDYTRGVKEAFDKGNIDIPYPTSVQIEVQG